MKQNIKNKLIEKYRNKLSEQFWAHDNKEEALLLKYIFVMLKIHIFELTQYYRTSKFKLDTNVKLMLINVYNNIMNIQKYLGDCKIGIKLSNKFAVNIAAFIEEFNKKSFKNKFVRCNKVKIPEKVITNNQILISLVNLTKDRFYKVLKMMDLSDWFDIVYENLIKYYAYYEDEIIKLREPVKESKFSKYVGMNLKNWKSMEVR
ncbi:MAG: hypothetical protein ACRCZI_00895 [Cetobacterium sp.]